MRKKQKSNTKPAAKRATPPKGLELSVNPRLVAFRVLGETFQGQTPEESLAEQGLLLERRDWNLSAALVYEVLRHRTRLDWLIKARLARGRAPAELSNILRLGVAQLLFFDRLGDHAIVMETVNLAKAVTPGRQGLVNAVLRGIIRDRDSGLWPPELPQMKNKREELALKYSYPEWLVSQVLDRFGPVESEALLAAGNEAVPPTIRINPLRAVREEVQSGLPFETVPTDISPWGLRLKSFSGHPEDWPGFAGGLFSIQDEASQLAGLLSGPLQPGAVILDACSGLGGKALHLAALYPQALVSAWDKDEPKLGKLRQEALRLGLENLRTERRDILTGNLPEKFCDLALVDAPCSGAGVIRRRPDLKWSKTPDDVKRLASLQTELLSAVASTVKPGGRLLYSVCSFSPTEGPEVVSGFLAERTDFAIAGTELWPEKLWPLLSTDQHLTLLPHRHQTDGFFWAMLIRRG